MPDRTNDKPALDGAVLNRPLTDASTGLTPTDPRLQEIVGMVVRGDYDAAALSAESLWNAKVYDVRLVGYYLYGTYVEQGIASLPLLFSSVLRTLRDNWALIGPAERKADAADLTLQWLFKTLSKHFEFHQARGDALWLAWSDPKSLPHVADALEAIPPVRQAIVDVLRGRTKALDRLAALDAWLTRLHEILRAEVSETAARAAVHQPVEMPAAEPGEALGPQPAFAAPASMPVLPFEVASPLAVFMRKLEAFKVLVERQDFTRAAVAAADIQDVIDHFDPRVYLPQLVAPFFALLGEHGETIEAQLQGAGSLGFKAMADLFRTDVDAFLK